jgi:hypothetical protein
MPGTGSAKRRLRPSGKSTARKQRHLRVTPAGSAVSLQSSNEKPLAEAMLRGTAPAIPGLTMFTRPLPGEVLSTVQNSPPSSPRSTVKSTSVRLSRHTLKNCENASGNEQFIHPLILIFGRETAEFLAARFGWSLQLPLPESRATTNERGRNYSARSAKRKPPSGSSTSSRSRSSTS